MFVTTHFLEEVDYCDWVSFIDAGRLIANATPEELRARYSDGYRVDARRCRPAAPRTREAALARGGLRGRPRATRTLALRRATLDHGALGALARRGGAARGGARRAAAR